MTAASLRSSVRTTDIREFANYRAPVISYRYKKEKFMLPVKRLPKNETIPFEEWCMPICAGGYLKAKKIDLL